MKLPFICIHLKIVTLTQYISLNMYMCINKDFMRKKSKVEVDQHYTSGE